jgi:ferritin
MLKNVTIKPKVINEELTEIDRLTKVEQPNTRLVNLNRYTKEKDSLTQIKDYVNNGIEEEEVSSNLVDKETVESKNLEVIRDKDTDEIIGYIYENVNYLDVYGDIV